MAGLKLGRLTGASRPSRIVRYSSASTFDAQSLTIPVRVGMTFLTLALAAWLLSAGLAYAAAGNVAGEQKISDLAGGFTGALDDGDEFGQAVAGLTDLDGNTVPDIAVGAPFDDDGGINRGAIWVQFLDTAGMVVSHQKISDTSGGFLGSLDDNDEFGMSATSLGDLDGDTVPDIAVGAPRDDDGGSNRGAVWILFLNANGTVKGHQKISDTNGNFSGSLANDDEFGFAVARIGDLDGDAITDLAVGAPFDDDGGTDRGATWILLMNANGTVKNQAKISDLTGGFGGSLADNDLFGSSLSAYQDLNNDGVEDLAIGAIGDSDGGLARGAVWNIFLTAAGGVFGSQKISDLAGGFTGTLNDFDNFGSSLAVTADLNADGVSDLMVGASGDDDGGSDRGAVWVLLMNTNGTVALRRKISSTTGGLTGPLANLDLFGSAVVSPKDIDADGVADLVVGARRDDDGGGQRGAVYVLFLDGTPGAFCGDTILDPGEDCDDGNVDNGDCCDSSCGFDPATTSCDDATICNGTEECDGAGTCLSGTVLDCDDSQPCTQDTCDPVLGCQSTSGPSAVCLLPGKTLFDVVDKADSSKDKIKWKWLKGEATLITDFGDPIVSTDYTLCVYDETAATPTLTSSLNLPPNGAWKPNSKGFKYVDKTTVFDGVFKLQLKSGSAGKAKVSFQARGLNINPALTPFDGANFYDQDGKVTVQLINGVGMCWSADLPLPALKNDVDRFKDKNPQ